MPAPISAASVANPMNIPGPASGPVLRDIHLPAEPSWWPLAPGWWLLAAGLLILLLLLVWWRRRQRVRQQWRAQVLIELDQAELAYRQDGDQHRLTGSLHSLLRRAAAALEPSAYQARGAAWEAVLDQIRVDAQTRQQLLGLEQAMYRRETGIDFEPEQAITAVRRWMQLAVRKLAAEHAGRSRSKSA